MSKHILFIIIAFLSLLSCTEDDTISFMPNRVIEVRKVFESQFEYLTFYYNENEMVERVNAYFGVHGNVSFTLSYDEEGKVSNISSFGFCDTCSEVFFDIKEGRIIKSVQYISSFVTSNMRIISHYFYNNNGEINVRLDTIINIEFIPFDTTALRISYEYDSNDNPIKITKEYENGDKTITAYNYDTNMNPFWGSYVDLSGNWNLIISRNNVIEERIGTQLVRTYSYEYQNGYPVSYTIKSGNEQSFLIVYE